MTEWLHHQAEQFRNCLLQARDTFSSDLRRIFHNFPANCSGESAVLLGMYLRELKLDVRISANGIRKGRDHAWVEVGPIILDITADQFCEGHGPVWVTQDRTWHSEFSDITQFDVADLNRYGLQAKEDLLHAYRQLKSLLDELPQFEHWYQFHGFSRSIKQQFRYILDDSNTRFIKSVVKSASRKTLTFDKRVPLFRAQIGSSKKEVRIADSDGNFETCDCPCPYSAERMKPPKIVDTRGESIPKASRFFTLRRTLTRQLLKQDLGLVLLYQLAYLHVRVM